MSTQETISMKESASTSSKGKRLEYFLASQMMKEGLQVYLPLVDDDGVDFVVKRPDGSFVELQVKASTENGVIFGSAAQFYGITHEERNNYWFVFYSERMATMWILSSPEFLRLSSRKKNGERYIWFNGRNKKRNTEHVLAKYEMYVERDFRRILTDEPSIQRENP